MAQETDNQNPIPEGLTGSEFADPQNGFLEAQWFGLPAEERGSIYLEYAFLAYIAPDSLYPNQWAILGASLRDEAGVAWAVDDALNSNLGIDAAQLLDPDRLAEVVEYASQGTDYWSSARASFNVGQQPPARFHDNKIAQGLFSVATLAAGIGIGVQAAKLTAAGVGFLAKTATGRAIASAIGKGAPYLDDVPAALERYGKVGFAITGTHVINYSVRDWLYATSDPQGLIDRGEKNAMQAAAERAGYTYESSGQAAGEDGLILAEGVIIRDPDGNIVSEEEVATFINDSMIDFDEAPEPLSAPSEIPGTRDTPQYQTTQQAPTGIVALDSGAPIGGAPGGMTQADFLLEQFEEQRVKEFNADPSLGVPHDFYRGPRDRSQLANDADLLRSRGVRNFMTEEMLKVRVPTSAIYQVSSVLDQVAIWSVFDLIAFQGKAIEAGLLNPDTLFSGAADPQTISALTTAMTQANINGNGMTFDEAMDMMVQARADAKELYGDEDQPPTWTPSRAYFAPDYATISQNVKGLFAQRLGRDPNEWEMDLLADEFRADHRSQYDEVQAGNRGVFDAKGRAEETGEIQIPDVQQDVDPFARMAENFDEDFSDELDAKSRWNDVQSKSRNLFGSFDKLSRA